MSNTWIFDRRYGYYEVRFGSTAKVLQSYFAVAFIVILLLGLHQVSKPRVYQISHWAWLVVTGMGVGDAIKCKVRKGHGSIMLGNHDLHNWRKWKMPRSKKGTLTSSWLGQSKESKFNLPLKWMKVNKHKWKMLTGSKKGTLTRALIRMTQLRVRLNLGDLLIYFIDGTV